MSIPTLQNVIITPVSNGYVLDVVDLEGKSTTTVYTKPQDVLKVVKQVITFDNPVEKAE